MGEARYRYDVNTYYWTYDLKIALNEIKYPTELVDVLVWKKWEFVVVTRSRISYNDWFGNFLTAERPIWGVDTEIPMWEENTEIPMV